MAVHRCAYLTPEVVTKRLLIFSSPSHLGIKSPEIVAIFHLFPALFGPVSANALIIHLKLQLFRLPSN